MCDLCVCLVCSCLCVCGVRDRCGLCVGAVSVIGVVLMDGAVEKIGLEMDVMVLWVEKTIIFVY